MTVICAQLLLEQEKKKKKTKKKNHVAAKKSAFCQRAQDQSSDADLAGAQLDTATCSPLEADENRKIGSASAALNPKRASAVLIYNPDINHSRLSVKA